MPKQKSYRFWFLAYPDLPKPVGGIKQIHRLAEFISSTIHKAIVVQDTSSFHPNWFESNVETIAKTKVSSEVDTSTGRKVVRRSSAK